MSTLRVTSHDSLSDISFANDARATFYGVYPTQFIIEILFIITVGIIYCSKQLLFINSSSTYIKLLNSFNPTILYPGGTVSYYTERYHMMT